MIIIFVVIIIILIAKSEAYLVFAWLFFTQLPDYNETIFTIINYKASSNRSSH